MITSNNFQNIKETTAETTLKMWELGMDYSINSRLVLDRIKFLINILDASEFETSNQDWKKGIDSLLLKVRHSLCPQASPVFFPFFSILHKKESSK